MAYRNDTPFTPFMRFWAAQNALCAMYGIADLNYGEAHDLWFDSGHR